MPESKRVNETSVAWKKTKTAASADFRGFLQHGRFDGCSGGHVTTALLGAKFENQLEEKEKIVMKYNKVCLQPN